MRREDLSIPAVTTLTSVDATAIRAIVSAFTKEIQSLRMEIDDLKRRQDMAYRNRLNREMR